MSRIGMRFSLQLAMRPIQKKFAFSPFRVFAISAQGVTRGGEARRPEKIAKTRKGENAKEKEEAMAVFRSAVATCAEFEFAGASLRSAAKQY